MAIYAFEHPIYDIVAGVVRKGATALVNASEHANLEAVHILTNILRLSIPKDISVVTMEGLPVFKYFTPPQTVVRQPFDELARQAVAHIIDLASPPKSRIRPTASKPVDITLPCELIERESVAKIGV
jgi:DNA-binding LacI/PurR family transcriptional regulator